MSLVQLIFLGGGGHRNEAPGSFFVISCHQTLAAVMHSFPLRARSQTAMRLLDSYWTFRYKKPRVIYPIFTGESTLT